MRRPSSQISSTRAPACTTRQTVLGRQRCTWLPGTPAPMLPSACWRPAPTPTSRTTWAGRLSTQLSQRMPKESSRYVSLLGASTGVPELLGHVPALNADCQPCDICLFILPQGLCPGFSEAALISLGILLSLGLRIC